ncbi:transketolase [Dethiosulfatibacter aminovorans DSM 17477]|uniref:Transketolase n=1 Tax=Dethiosulfatibacter aminovorans DSM 17477 TaxID=1121476 RepID=A0A1M6L1X9_9FIRM|nr:transketolase [Dethiosulfatibacter aminovorans]SHJ65173.1 transketolase [Dethiosulfatibacter aminovorans DSM 17477]
MNQNQTSINAMRMLGVDMINKANSGHPGIVLGAAPMMYSLYSEHMAYNPAEPKWFNRDRFVMAAGHGSGLLYSMLHLTGHNLSMDELKDFRQWESKTPGHPEYNHTEGVDTTSGPLGQGIAMATGMAIAELYMANRFNKEGYPVVDHHTFVLCGDGDLQEGVTQEAISLAGHLGLSKLVVLYDSNDIQLDGPVSMANSEDVKAKYESMNWSYLRVEDGEDAEAVAKAIEEAKKITDKPTIIEIKTVIGHGSPDAGSSSTHGSPIGEEKTVVTREALGWNHGPFEIPQEVYDDFKAKNEVKGVAAYESWAKMIEEYKAAYPEDAKYLLQTMNGEALDIDYDKIFDGYEPKASVATRASSGDVLKLLQGENPLLIGGSADLSGSTKVKGIDGNFSAKTPAGRNINYGVREHAMAAVVNGLTLHGLKGFGGGFFIFSDYMRPAMRMAALMGIPSIFAFTHDSVAVGEDGPTHEPVEQLAGLRAVPNMDVIRPADANEVMAAWQLAVESKTTPTSLVFTRQNVPTLDQASREGVAKGGYVISPEADKIDAILIATGSEVALAIESQKALKAKGIDTRVVSLPSFKRFNEQSAEYKESVLPLASRKRLGIEMGASLGWGQYVGLEGKLLTIDQFGASAPGGLVIEKYGFNVENVVKIVEEML